jgi:hypothetical protein
MVEMKFISGSADDTAAVVPLPDFDLDSSWDHPSTLLISRQMLCRRLVSNNGDEFEAEYLATGPLLAPAIN